MQDSSENMQAAASRFGASVVDRSLGAVFGAFIGDALGSYLEFIEHVDSTKLETALLMPGGGPFKLGSGQATDDSELAMCLMRGLLEGNGKLNLDRVANYYGQWVETDPFDIGITTSIAFEKLAHFEKTASVAILAAQQGSQDSQSNGCLMRATPLCVWAYKLSDNHVAEAAILECSMTHPNLTVNCACACYALAISHLIKNPNDRLGAYSRSKAWAEASIDQGIKEWYKYIEDTEAQMPGTPRMGWAKIAFTHAFKQLLKGSDYPTAIRETLAIGGDTDTNAAIVGGLIGSAVGYEALPREWLEKVETYTYEEKGGRSRPPFLYQPSIKQQVLDLLLLAPETLTYIIDSESTPGC
mmetsp:Transcript_5352/g.9828  ORF Transcript_5352/g.9828 Transcript_5352/m.9828 type:complete len:356 (-) Transcript_5352:1183-2250(-)